MTRREQGPRFAPSAQGIAIVRERLQRMGLPVTDAAARSLVEALLALEGPRLYAVAQGNLENSLEIIRDTAESALTSLRVTLASLLHPGQPDREGLPPLPGKDRPPAGSVRYSAG